MHETRCPSLIRRARVPRPKDRQAGLLLGSYDAPQRMPWPTQDTPLAGLGSHVSHTIGLPIGPVVAGQLKLGSDGAARGKSGVLDASEPSSLAAQVGVCRGTVGHQALLATRGGGAERLSSLSDACSASMPNTALGALEYGMRGSHVMRPAVTGG